MGLACNYREHMPLPKRSMAKAWGGPSPQVRQQSGAPVSPVKQTLLQGKAWLEAPADCRSLPIVRRDNPLPRGDVNQLCRLKSGDVGAF